LTNLSFLLLGFDLGDTIQSETKGIWIWCRQHPTKSDQVLVLLDTEGLDDPEKVAFTCCFLETQSLGI
jgi:hypothetical protein